MTPQFFRWILHLQWTEPIQSSAGDSRRVQSSTFAWTDDFAAKSTRFWKLLFSAGAFWLQIKCILMVLISLILLFPGPCGSHIRRWPGLCVRRRRRRSKNISVLRWRWNFASGNPRSTWIWWRWCDANVPLAAEEVRFPIQGLRSNEISGCVAAEATQRGILSRQFG